MSQSDDEHRRWRRPDAPADAGTPVDADAEPGPAASADEFHRDPWDPDLFTPIHLDTEDETRDRGVDPLLSAPSGIVTDFTDLRDLAALAGADTGEVRELGEPTPAAGTPTASRHAKRRRYWLRRTVFATLALLLLALGYYGLTLYQVWSTGRHDQARPVDAIVVMGAAQYDGRPSPLLKARLDHALELYQADVAPLIVVTGGKQEGDRYTEASASSRYLRQQGVPANVIIEETSGHSTWQSLEGVAALLNDRGTDPSVLIVTDPFHSLRSRLVAQELGLTAYTSPTTTSPWGSGTQFKKSLKEAAGIALGRIIGFHRLWKVTG